MSALSYSLLAAIVAGGVAADPFATITALPRATDAVDMEKRIIGYSQTTTYETTSPLPLTDYYYAYSAVPYQVNPYPVGRGPQSGYNQCNSTTEGPNSQCQTLEFNSLDDFCIWGAPGTDQLTGDIEAATVKYCTKGGHGGRVVPPGTFSGLQFMRTPAYIQITGNYDRTKIGLSQSDQGGELDPHGADLLGNPLGGLVYSKSLPSGDNTTYQQTQSWNQFFDGGVFCIKLCDPNWTGDDKNYCQNIYDIIGCSYNMPAAYQDDVFLSCEGDLQDEVGTYTSDGQTITWSQPSSLSPSTTLPWKPRVPASSNCMTYQSTDLFPASDLGYLANATASGASGSASASITAAMSGMAGGNVNAASAGSDSGSMGRASQTVSAGSAAASGTKSGAASRNVQGAGVGVGLMGLVLALFL